MIADAGRVRYSLITDNQGNTMRKSEHLEPVTLTTQPMIDALGQTLPAAWVPGTGETPCKTRSGITILYCWNRHTGEKAWLNCDTDIFMSNDDARRAMWPEEYKTV